MRRVHATKAGRRDADNRDRNALDVDSFAENFLVAAESALPPGIAQNRNGRVCGFVLEREPAAQNGLDTQTGEEIPTDHFAPDLFRLARNSHGHFLKSQRGKSDDVLENFLACAHRCEDRHGHGHIAVACLRSV